MEFVKVPAGLFIMGNTFFDDSVPVRKIYLDDYEIGKYPVTNWEYGEFTGVLAGESDHPVVNVSWYEAMEYCKWLSEKTNSTITLPTEAQFVKAARGGIWLDGVKNPLPRRKYPWGDKRPNELLSNYNSDKTTPVTSHPKGASPYGCQGMAGNLWQWCLDWYDSEYYAEMPKKNPVKEEDRYIKVLLGGSSDYGAENVMICNRGYSDPIDNDGQLLGFRCVKLIGR